MNLYQDVFFRAPDGLRGRRTVERLHFLRESQRWDGERLRAWQLEQLNALLRQAQDASPFHRERLVVPESGKRRFVVSTVEGEVH